MVFADAINTGFEQPLGYESAFGRSISTKID